ncbi:hypothetical protein FC89_GL001167 [Liquorilactobacillus ghanensis DSM 18630]|uniref:alpha-L-rhamnosidase n=1 Tax=Liquorilactobacillus ghanensis DSM 18630 TaxID=1423750 RepID=A0A0R1VL15_9LACO|nr:family 78 glycoside hydrolase catalytic domain [Liquorilactobacillus ghanensis]KRM06295.1 hypothetical protein FC89_GL001167 [Liquorilactobacillus ghanensis DSM 18630]
MSTKICSLQTPDHLKVNLISFAYNITSNPRFSWWNHSQNNGSYQTAFQIVISHRLRDIKNQTYLFDSNWIYSTNNTSIVLNNLNDKLIPGELYYWKVRIKDNLGNTSAFSEPEKFICQAPLKEEPFHGIWSPASAHTGKSLPNLGNVVFFRSPKIKLDLKQIDSAIITAFSRGSEPQFIQGFDIYMNEKSVGVGSARPQPNYHNYNKTAVFYNDYDVTDFLNIGDNVISVIAGGTSKRRSLWLKLTLYLLDGTKKDVCITDNTWKALDASSAFGDFGSKARTLYFEMVLENIDMQYYPQKWNTVTFDDSKWTPAWINPDLMLNEEELLVPFDSENSLRIKIDEPAKKITKLAEQNYLIDLGKEIIGSLKVNIVSSKDQRFNVLLGEQKSSDGHVRHHLACGPDYIENWTLVKGVNQFSTFQVKNFRYIELVGFQGELNLNSISAWAIQQPFNDAESCFESDNDLLNREYELSKYTIKATNQDLFVDSQARERRPYEGDLLVNAQTSYAVSSHYSLSRHSIDYLIDNPTWPEDYKLFIVEMAWLDYLYTGDFELLNKRYDDLKIKFNRGKNSDSFDGASNDFKGNLRNTKGADNFDSKVGLVTNNGLIDWPIPERDGFIEGTYNTPFNAIYYGTYLIMGKIAHLTHHEKDEKFFIERAHSIKKQLINRLYDEKTGTFFDSLNADLTINKHSSHHSSAYALCYGVYKNQDMADKLSKFVANDGKFVGSIYFIYFILKGLIDCNHADQAITLLTNQENTKDAKTFAAILDNLEATIAPEAWSNHYKPNMTLSHPWGATPGLTIVQGIFGINPLSAGFDKFAIKVRPGKLQKLKVTTPSPKGLIKIDYCHLTPEKVELTVTIPMNSQAVVEIPNQANQILLDKHPITTNTFELKSGKYTISYNQPQPV